jgi:mRNA interferase HicA
MKRHELLRHLRLYGCILKREGTRHSLYINPTNGVVETIPRHVEIDNRLARKICIRLKIPEPGQVSEN